MKLEDLKIEIKNIKNGNYTWKILFFILKKTKNAERDYNITFYSCDCTDGSIPNTIKDNIINNLINRTFKKLENDIVEYVAGQDEKVALTSLDVNDPIVKDNYKKFSDSLDNPQISTELNKFSGYVIHGHKLGFLDKSESIIFINKVNPVFQTKNAKFYRRVCPLTIEKYDASETSFRFYSSIDCFVYKGHIFSNTLDFEEIFNLENTKEIRIAHNLQRINSNSYFNDLFKGYIMAMKKNDLTAFFKIQEEYFNLETEEDARKFCSDFGFNFENGKIQTNTKEEIQELLNILTRKGSTDVRGNKVIGSNLYIKS